MTMFRQHLNQAIRHLAKKKNYTFLNLFGLSVGLACFAIIGLRVKSELSFDRFHEKSDRIYRVVSTLTDPTSVINQAVTSPPLGPALLTDFPEVQQIVRIDPGDMGFTLEDKSFLEQGIVTDQSFFELFDFSLIHGDRNYALKEPYSVVLSQNMAEKYFGTSDAVGQLIKGSGYDADGNGAMYKVTGVIQNCPSNSHFFYDYIISFSTWETVAPQILRAEGWNRNSIYTYILLDPNADADNVQAKLPAFGDRYLGAAMTENNVRFDFSLQKMTDIHLHSNLSYEIGANGNFTYVIAFATIGIIVLLLACINYVNLSTAYATARFKEVGIHKVMGAAKRQLMSRYLAESWILAMASLVVTFGWIELSRPIFEAVTETKMTGLYTIANLSALMGIASFVGLAAGLYPAAVLSRLKPVSILKGQAGPISGNWLRKSLVIVQFSATIILVIGIIAVQLQMKFINTRDLGFNKNNLVVFGVHGSNEVRNGYNAFANELISGRIATGITRSNTTIGNGLGTIKVTLEDGEGKQTTGAVYGFRVDHDYLDVYDMKLVAGRNFLFDNSADSTRAFLVNESLTRTYGYANPADIIGKHFDVNGNDGQVIGVVKDFNFASLRQNVEPVFMSLLNVGFSRVSIRIDNAPNRFPEVEALWKKHFPSSVLQYSFYEDSLGRSYRAESRFSGIFLLFSIVSLVIACLGLFALVSYNVERRAKEIGIRKVLGATLMNIVSMVSIEFIGLVLASCVIAIPVGYYFMNEWLANFAYHISPDALIFVSAGALVLAIAWATVSVRTFKAASANPVVSLRNE